MEVLCYLEGHVGNVDQLVVCEREQVEEAQLGESSGLDLFHAITVDHELLQRGQAIEGLLDSTKKTKTKRFLRKKWAK